MAAPRSARALRLLFFQSTLLTWFDRHARDFVWRKKTAKPYVKIISEVFLQRTKAETVNKFMSAFLKDYPSWEALALASEADLVAALKPIGLHQQRGKRLYLLAQELARRGGFPARRSDVEDLPQMGQYITNAYELFILRKPAPLLDVNMARVLERYFGARKLRDIRYDRKLQRLAKTVVSMDAPVEMNWAILDFAAAICRARHPKCADCPLVEECKFPVTNGKAR